MYDFANILFSGACSARCPFCIGRQIDPALNQPNLDRYPPLNLESLIEIIWHHGIKQVVFTGSDTDPQCYRHEARLLAFLRQQLPPGTQFSLHTNGRLALKKMAIFNQYDRACLSLPAFDPLTYQKMMGRSKPPDLESILTRALVPVKISCVLTSHNIPEIPIFLERCESMGVRRVVLRKLYGEDRPWSELLPWDRLDLVRTGCYRGNTIFSFNNMEVTLWDFRTTHSTAVNLFSNGLLSCEYLISQAGSGAHIQTQTPAAQSSQSQLSSWTAEAPALMNR